MIKKRLRTIRSGIRHLTGRADDSNRGSNEDAETGRPSGPSSGLFECPECKTVYVDADKERCRSCRADVTEVRSTLATE